MSLHRSGDARRRRRRPSRTEFARRNAEDDGDDERASIQAYPEQWNDLTAKVPQLAQLPAEMREAARRRCRSAGVAVFPALLALESLAALALAWATYHRLSRARLGAPLRPLREFRFNDQLVWGLIVGLTIVLAADADVAARRRSQPARLFRRALRGARLRRADLVHGAGQSRRHAGGRLRHALRARAQRVRRARLHDARRRGARRSGLGDTWADWRSRARPTS